MDHSLPGPSVHEISQARMLYWVAISFPRASSWPRDSTCVSCIGRWILYQWATGKALSADTHIINQVHKEKHMDSQVLH